MDVEGLELEMNETMNETMKLFDHPEFDQHEMVCFCSDKTTGLKAIIAVHNTKLGPAFGGCRMLNYPSEADALKDALRLSRGMTYKNALAGLAFGGGKSVIIGNPTSDKRPDLLHAFAREVDRLGGLYVTAEDSNIDTRDVSVISERTHHVRNLPLDETGEPSAVTAWGVFHAMKAALSYRSHKDIADARVVVEGLGHVGMELCRFLHEAGASLIVSDIDEKKVTIAKTFFDARPVDAGTAYRIDADIYAPCALGGILNESTIPHIRAPIIVGAANNQLATPHDAYLLKEAGILYCPDYVVNAGGVLSVPPAGKLYDRQWALDRASKIAITLTKVLHLADQQGIPTHEAANSIVEQILVS